MQFRYVSQAVLSLAVFALVSGLFFSTGCSSHRPEENPYLIDKFAELDEAQKALDELRRDVVFVQDEIKYLNEELQNIRTMNGGLTPAEQEKLNAFMEKFAQVEQMTASLDNVVKSGVSATKSASPPVAAKAEAPSKSTSSAPAAKSTSAPAPKKTTVAAAKTPTKSTTTASTTKQRTTRRGFYYNVKPNEDLAKIAAGNGITVQALSSANRLPANATLVPGQRIWVP